MSNKPQAPTRQALDLINQGMSARAAAKTTGIAVSTIYRCKAYRERVGIAPRVSMPLYRLTDRARVMYPDMTSAIIYARPAAGGAFVPAYACSRRCVKAMRKANSIFIPGVVLTPINRLITKEQ